MVVIEPDEAALAAFGTDLLSSSLWLLAFAARRDRARRLRKLGVSGSRNVKRVLITGMSGTGKSSLPHDLAARGYRIVDADYGGYFQTIDAERLWREDRITALLSSAPGELPGALFIQGTARNQALFYPRFHHIVLLSAPPGILAERLATRTTNPLRERSRRAR